MDNDPRYAPNAILWEPGALVIHSADAKEARMLMRVLRYTREGLCVTEYVDGSVWPGRRNRFENDVKHLLDPARFGIEQLEGVKP